MARRTGRLFRLARLKSFFSILIHNRMAFTGLVMLSIFVILAAGAPIITRYDPQGSVVAAQLAAPGWITWVTGDRGWSGNTQFEGIDTRTPGSATVTVNQDSVTDSSIDFQVNSQVNRTKVLLVKKLSYPFNGPPGRFDGYVRVTPSGLSPSRPAEVRVYIERVTVTAESWTIWNSTVSSSRVYAPISRLDSNTDDIRKRIGIDKTVYNGAQVIFDRQADYEYVLEIILPQGQAGFSIRTFEMRLLGNSWGYLGTDNGGLDIFSQLIYGARISLFVGLLATFIGVGLGLVVGLIAGYMGKVVDEVLMRFTDMMLVIPGLPLLIVLVAVLGPGIWVLIGVIGFLGWMGFARVVRSQVLSLRERPFIEAAKASGAGTGYITVKHIFPNIVSLTYVNLALSVPGAIVAEAALSFLGLGDPTVISWGRMLEEARSTGAVTNLLWWWTVPPGISIALLSLSFILLGYALDDIFNPKLRKRR